MLHFIYSHIPCRPFVHESTEKRFFEGRYFSSTICSIDRIQAVKLKSLQINTVIQGIQALQSILQKVKANFIVLVFDVPNIDNFNVC